MAHLIHSDIGLEMGPKIGLPYPRLGHRETTHLLDNEWAAISGRSWGKSRPMRHQSGRPSVWALVAVEESLFRSHFQPDIGSVKMCRKLRNSYPQLGPRKTTPLTSSERSAISGRP